MQINHIEYFLEVTRSHSISKAAKKLFITQSTLSAAITTLENELGFKLFKRMHQGVVLTPEGEAIVEEAYNIINTITNWKMYTKDDSSNISGTIHIMSQPAITSYVLINVLKRCYDEYPLVNLHVNDTYNKMFFESFLKNETSIGLAFYTPSEYDFIYEQAQIYKLNTEILYFDTMLIYFNQESALKEKKEISINDLLSYNLVTYPEQMNQNYKTLYECFNKKKVVLLPKSTDMLRFISMQKNSFGLFSSLLKKEVQDHTDMFISTSKINDFPTPIIIVMFYPKENHLTLVQKIALNLIREEFRKL